MNDPQQGGDNSTTEPLIVALTYDMDLETLTQWQRNGAIARIWLIELRQRRAGESESNAHLQVS